MTPVAERSPRRTEALNESNHGWEWLPKGYLFVLEVAERGYILKFSFMLLSPGRKPRMRACWWNSLYNIGQSNKGTLVQMNVVGSSWLVVQPVHKR